MSKKLREDILKLIEEKDKLENEIKELNAILRKNNVGMDDPLVDEEDFPLPGIDIYQVRHTRHLLIHKQNDHKNLMKAIEEGVANYYENKTPLEVPVVIEEKEPEIQRLQPFARITIVHRGSPADIAGIHDGDLLVEFGSINGLNFRSLQDIGDLVQHSKGHKINVKIEREGRMIRVALIPKQWSGIGLLGCSVVPV